MSVVFWPPLGSTLTMTRRMARQIMQSKWCRGLYRAKAQCLSSLGLIWSHPSAFEGSILLRIWYTSPSKKQCPHSNVLVWVVHWLKEEWKCYVWTQSGSISWKVMPYLDQSWLKKTCSSQQLECCLTSNAIYILIYFCSILGAYVLIRLVS